MQDNVPADRFSKSDEIDLVDLARIVVRRRKLFYAVFAAILAVGIAIAFLKPVTYEYASLYRVAESGQGKYVEEPGSSVATLSSQLIPEVEVLYREKAGHPLPFDVLASNPGNTGLVILKSVAPKENYDTVRKVHGAIIDKLKEAQQAKLQNQKQGLQLQLDSINQVIEELAGSQAGAQDGAMALASAYGRRADVEASLRTLKPAETLVIARQSAGAQGASKALIVALAGVLAVMIGVMSIFVIEFVSKVREKN